MSVYSHQTINGENSQSKLLKWINKGDVVLEFGPSAGYMTQYMKEELECKVYIVELDKEDFKKASQYSEDGIHGDITSYKWLKKWKKVKFDKIIFADVLEHLYWPGEVLQKTKPLLKENGEVLISLPNGCHDIVIAEMIHNQFNYRDSGLQDRTHIRWFGHGNLKSFFGDAGFSIAEEDFILNDRHSIERYADYQNDLLEKLLASRTGGNVYQFIERLVKTEYASKKKIKQKSKFSKLTSESKKIPGKRVE
jgi:SAM-dependent methyltransferase